MSSHPIIRNDAAFKQIQDRLRDMARPAVEPAQVQEQAGRPKLDMVGETSGQLTVREYEGRFISGGTAGKPRWEHFWICECVCGTKVSVSTSNLRHQRIKRCVDCRRGPRLNQV